MAVEPLNCPDAGSGELLQAEASTRRLVLPPDLPPKMIFQVKADCFRISAISDYQDGGSSADRFPNLLAVGGPVGAALTQVRRLDSAAAVGLSLDSREDEPDGGADDSVEYSSPSW